MSNKTPLQIAIDAIDNLQIDITMPPQYIVGYADAAKEIKQKLTDLLPAEREGIERAYVNGQVYCGCELVKDKLASDYFNETFKSE